MEIRRSVIGVVYSNTLKAELCKRYKPKDFDVVYRKLIITGVIHETIMGVRVADKVDVASMLDSIYGDNKVKLKGSSKSASTWGPSTVAFTIVTGLVVGILTLIFWEYIKAFFER